MKRALSGRLAALSRDDVAASVTLERPSVSSVARRDASPLRVRRALSDFSYTPAKRRVRTLALSGFRRDARRIARAIINSRSKKRCLHTSAALPVSRMRRRGRYRALHSHYRNTRAMKSHLVHALIMFSRVCMLDRLRILVCRRRASSVPPSRVCRTRLIRRSRSASRAGISLARALAEIAGVICRAELFRPRNRNESPSLRSCSARRTPSARW